MPLAGTESFFTSVRRESIVLPVCVLTAKVSLVEVVLATLVVLSCSLRASK